jgi:Protein of unknown function (DUF2894)
MNPDLSDARATLAAWREQQADRFDPLRFHFIQAMQQRAAEQSGEVRRRLERRLTDLLAAYAADLEQAHSRTANVVKPTMQSTTARSALSGLTEHIANGSAVTSDDLATSEARGRAATFPELETLAQFRAIWSKLRLESQVRQSLKPTPGNAGPLNSSALAHRTIALMRDLSPGYLEHFLPYLDTLSWMEQMNRGGSASKAAPQAVRAKQRARSKRS